MRAGQHLTRPSGCGTPRADGPPIVRQAFAPNGLPMGGVVVDLGRVRGLAVASPAPSRTASTSEHTNASSTRTSASMDNTTVPSRRGTLISAPSR